MADKLIKAEGFAPVVLPYGSTIVRESIHRAQELTPGGTLNWQEDYELGNADKVSNTFLSADVPNSLTQREYGSMSFFRRLANAEDSVDALTLADFATSAFDIASYMTDSDGDFFGTVWYEKQRLSGFSITISDPKAVTDRSFSFTGEDVKMLAEDSKYLISNSYTVQSDDTATVALLIGESGDGYENDPIPNEDPKNAGIYILRAVRIRAGVVSDLVPGTSISFDGTNTLTITGCAYGDIIKWYYGASTYTSGSNPWVANGTDLGSIIAHSASIYLGSSNYLYRLQDVTLDVALTRADYGEIGNDEVTQRDTEKNEVTVTLGRLMSEKKIEDILSGTVDSDLVDIKEFDDDFTLIIAFYSDARKTSFKMGYKATSLYPSSWTPGSAAIAAVVKAGDVLKGDALTITSNLTTLGLS